MLSSPLCLEGLEGLLAVGGAVEEVVVHAGYDTVLVQDVRDAAVDGAEHRALHLPRLAHLISSSSGQARQRGTSKKRGSVGGMVQPLDQGPTSGQAQVTRNAFFYGLERGEKIQTLKKAKASL